MSRKVWWKVAELHEHYGLSRKKIYELIASGELKGHLLGGVQMVHDEDRREWENAGQIVPKRKRRGYAASLASAPAVPQEEVDRVLASFRTA